MPEIDNTQATINKFEPLLKGLSKQELLILNKMIVERLRLMQRAGALMSMSLLTDFTQKNFNRTLMTQIFIIFDDLTLPTGRQVRDYLLYPCHLRSIFNRLCNISY